MTATLANPPRELTAFLESGSKIVDIRQVSSDMQQYAEGWLKVWEGNFSFLVDVRSNMVRNNGLTVGQAKGVLNCWMAEQRRGNRPTSAQAPSADLEGFHLFGNKVYKVQISKAGRPYAKRLNASGRGWTYDRGGIYNLGEKTRLTLEQAKALGHQTGRCVVCQRELTVPESIAAGIGPICAAKF